MSEPQTTSPVMPLNRPSDEVEFDFGGLLYRLFKKKRLIAAVGLLGVLSAILYVTVLYVPKYTSTAMLFMETDAPGSVVNQYGGRIARLLDDVDPFKTQQEIISSEEFYDRTFEGIKGYALSAKYKSPGQLRGAFSAKHIKGTEFIELSTEARDPVEAQQLAVVFIRVYKEMAEEIYIKPFIERKQAILQQIEQVESKIKKNSLKLQAYQEANQVVNVDSQSADIASQVSDLQTKLLESKALLSEKVSEQQKISEQLGADLKSALAGIAASSGPYQRYVEQLSALESEWDAKSTTYTLNHPYMVRLKQRIESLKQQMTGFISKSAGARLGTKKLMIMDPTRAKLVENFASADSQMYALREKIKSYSESLVLLEKQLSQFPAKQQTYSRLNLEQSNLRIILDRLQQGLAEVKVQESYRQLFDYAAPDLPQKPSSPSKVILLMGISAVSLLLPILWVVLGYVGEQMVLPQRSFFEGYLQIPVLTVIPWLSRKDLEKQNLSSQENSYRTLALNVRRAYGAHPGVCLAMAPISSDTDKPSHVIVNVAQSLAQMGDSVLIVDATLSKARLCQALGQERHESTSAIQWISQLGSHDLSVDDHHAKVLIAQIKAKTITSQFHPNLKFFDLGDDLEVMSFEFFNSPAFMAFLALIKSQYDWVLMDVPAIRANAASLSLAESVDASILMVEHDATKRQVEDVCRQLHQVQAPILGAILREQPS